MKPRIFKAVVRTGYRREIRATFWMCKAFGGEYMCGSFEGALAQLGWLYYEQRIAKQELTGHIV